MENVVVFVRLEEDPDPAVEVGGGSKSTRNYLNSGARVPRRSSFMPVSNIGMDLLGGVNSQTSSAPNVVTVDDVETFDVDGCFSCEETNADVFSALGPAVVRNCLNGYHTTVFAYGSRTAVRNTTEGREDLDETTIPMTLSSENSVGFIVRLLSSLLNELSAKKNNIIDSKVLISSFEFLKDDVGIVDRLGGSGDKLLRVREHPNKGPYVENLKTNEVNTEREVLNVLDSRTPNHSNATHSVTAINVDLAKVSNEGAGAMRLSCCVKIVDLMSDADNSVLESVVERLSGDDSAAAIPHMVSVLDPTEADFANTTMTRPISVPYRDSSLTWLLRESLGGNSRTILLAHLSSSRADLEKTYETMEFVANAKKIVNMVSKNEDPSSMLIRKMRSELASVKAELNNPQFDSKNALKKLQSKHRKDSSLYQSPTLALKIAEAKLERAHAEIKSLRQPSKLKEEVISMRLKVINAVESANELLCQQEESTIKPLRQHNSAFRIQSCWRQKKLRECESCLDECETELSELKRETDVRISNLLRENAALKIQSMRHLRNFKRSNVACEIETSQREADIARKAAESTKKKVAAIANDLNKLHSEEISKIKQDLKKKVVVENALKRKIVDLEARASNNNDAERLRRELASKKIGEKKLQSEIQALTTKCSELQAESETKKALEERLRNKQEDLDAATEIMEEMRKKLFRMEDEMAVAEKQSSTKEIEAMLEKRTREMARLAKLNSQLVEKAERHRLLAEEAAAHAVSKERRASASTIDSAANVRSQALHAIEELKSKNVLMTQTLCVRLSVESLDETKNAFVKIRPSEHASEFEISKPPLYDLKQNKWSRLVLDFFPSGSNVASSLKVCDVLEASLSHADTELEHPLKIVDSIRTSSRVESVVLDFDDEKCDPNGDCFCFKFIEQRETSGPMVLKTTLSTNKGIFEYNRPLLFKNAHGAKGLRSMVRALSASAKRTLGPHMNADWVVLNDKGRENLQSNSSRRSWDSSFSSSRSEANSNGFLTSANSSVQVVSFQGYLMKRRAHLKSGHVQRWFVLAPPFLLCYTNRKKASLDFSDQKCDHSDANRAILLNATHTQLYTEDSDEGALTFVVETKEHTWSLEASNVEDLQRWTSALRKALLV